MRGNEEKKPFFENKIYTMTKKFYSNQNKSIANIG
jgi:hypothetical protein